MSTSAILADQPPPFPLFLDLRGRTALVLGQGEAADRKDALLRRFGATVRRLRQFDAAGLAGCALAFGAGADADDLAALSRAAQHAGIPVNVVDRPDLCSALSPSIVDRAPLIVAISTGGAAPVLARRVRSAIDRALPPGLGRLGTLLERLKPALREGFPDIGRRRQIIERVLDGPAAAIALEGDLDGAAALALRQIAAAGNAVSGVVHLVAIGPGEADLLTLRAQRVMGEADTLLHDGTVPAAVLDLARRDAGQVIDAAPVARMIALARDGKSVVRLAAGAMPAGFAAERAELAGAGVTVFVVPGAVAASHLDAVAPSPTSESLP